jgi:hypothetical protein
MPDADGNPTAEEAAATIAAARQQQADTAALQEQLTQAQARNLELEVAAIRAANPDLPDAAFAGSDLATIQAGVTTARAVADHVRQQAEASRNGVANPGAPPITPPAAGTQRKAEIPANIHGIGRIAFALSNPGPGMTE